MDGALQDDLVRIQDDVRASFGWSHDDDEASALALRSACESRAESKAFHWSRKGRRETMENIRTAVSQADAVVLVGAAAQRQALDRPWPEGTVFVAADGAVGACLGLVAPVCVVTDLDGGEHLDAAVLAGVPLVVHAHGDNQATWSRCLDNWADAPPSIVLTHQCRHAIEGMVNPGGFTDGDRAACLMRWLGVDDEKLVFLGFSTDRVGSWSGTTEPVRKLEKLQWMARVLDMLSPTWRSKALGHES